MWFAKKFKPQLWPDEIFWKENDSPKDTGDMAKLQQAPFQLLFVYNQLMDGHRSFPILENSVCPLSKNKPGIPAFTQEHNLVMYKKRLGMGSYPIVLKEETIRRNLMGQPLVGRVKGELYAVESKCYSELDSYMCNGVEFRRKRTRVLVPFRKKSDRSEEFIKVVNAWMYFGKRSYWLGLLDGGYEYTTVKMYEPHNQYIDGELMGSYYAFTQMEYER